MKALVLGGTGATGFELIKQLLANDRVGSVVTLGRRKMDVPESLRSFEAKLDQRVVNLDNMGTEAKDAFDGVDTVFCALGTTRGVAGSAEAFQKIDLEYVAKSAELAKKAGVKQYSLVSAQGANPRVWANNLLMFHPLLYMKTKGLAENAVKEQGFQRVSIMRPGLLDRGQSERTIEKVFKNIGSNIMVSDVAKVMISQALKPLGASPEVQVLEMKDLQKLAKE